MGRVFAILGQRLGARNALPPILRHRLQCLARLYSPGDRIIVCGGNVCGARCTHTEAYMMRRFLMHTQGIPRKDFWLDNTSKTTVGNILHLRTLCRKHGVRRVTLITSAWHLPRVKTLCARLHPCMRLHFVGSREKISESRMRRERQKHQALLAQHA